METCNTAITITKNLGLTDIEAEKKLLWEIDAQMQKCYQALGAGSSDEQREQAMNNPEVQRVLGDPVMQQILRQMQDDPSAIREHMKNPEFAKKMRILTDAGVVQMR
jgi:stress-induced-phosphoprotein 1